jgi:hypothetical protein
MKWLSGIFWIIIAVVTGVANYGVKHVVQSLDDELSSVRRKTITAQKQIHELSAEWTYLNQPELLADLNHRYLGLTPVTPKQLQRNIADIPLRPAPPLEAAPETTPEPQIVAATPTPPSTPAPAPAAIVPVVAAAAPSAAPVQMQSPGSLDALFALVAGGR